MTHTSISWLSRPWKWNYKILWLSMFSMIRTNSNELSQPVSILLTDQSTYFLTAKSKYYNFYLDTTCTLDRQIKIWRQVLTFFGQDWYSHQVIQHGSVAIILALWKINKNKYKQKLKRTTKTTTKTVVLGYKRHECIPGNQRISLDY